MRRIWIACALTLLVAALAPSRPWTVLAQPLTFGGQRPDHPALRTQPRKHKKATPRHRKRPTSSHPKRTTSSKRKPTHGRHPKKPKPPRTKLSMLLGNRHVEASLDNASPGSAQAFRFVDHTPGVATAVRIYVDSRNRARVLVAGLYSSGGRHPRSRLTSGRMTSPRGRAWDLVRLRPATLKAGRTYWLVVAGTGGSFGLRSRTGVRCRNDASRQRNLRALPRSWRRDKALHRCGISAFVLGRPSHPGYGVLQSPSSHLPANAARPQISGVTLVGSALTASPGSWTNSPTGYGYQWLRCDAGGRNCAAIPGATSAAYTVQPSDLNATLAVVVTAANSAGSTPVSSGPPESGCSTSATRAAATRMPARARALRGSTHRA